MKKIIYNKNEIEIDYDLFCFQSKIFNLKYNDIECLIEIIDEIPFSSFNFFINFMINNLKYPNYQHYDNVYLLCKKWNCHRLIRILEEKGKPNSILLNSKIIFNNFYFLINYEFFYNKSEFYKKNYNLNEILIINSNFTHEDFSLFIRFIHEEILFNDSNIIYSLLLEWECNKILKEFENNNFFNLIKLYYLINHNNLINEDNFLNLFYKSINIYIEKDDFIQFPITFLFKIFENSLNNLNLNSLSFEIFCSKLFKFHGYSSISLILFILQNNLTILKKI